MFNSVTGALFLTFFIVFTNQVNLKQNTGVLPISESQIPIKPVKPKSIIRFTIDDVVTRIFINENEIVPQYTLLEASQWASTKTMNVQLAPGDNITFVGKDTKKVNAGFIATIYFNTGFVSKIINTGTGWICDGKKATLKGKNDGSAFWPIRSLIHNNAFWIWNDLPIQTGTEVSCSYTIPLTKDLVGQIDMNEETGVSVK